MKVYFVRHGESEMNATSKHQTSNVVLSQKGIAQATNAANRLRNTNIDQIFSSTFARTLETAEVIATKLDKKINTSELFIERKKPSVYAGKSTTDPILQEIKEKILQNLPDPNWHYAEEENFYDLKNRAKKALKFLSEQKGENIVVVSHRGLLFIIVSEILLGDKFNHELYIQLDKTLKLSNTGITVCEFKNNVWSLLTWNDINHLEAL